MDLKKFLKIFLIVSIIAIILSVIFLIKDLSEKRELKRIEEEQRIERELIQKEFQEDLNNLDFEFINDLMEENPEFDI
jgi:hypothetical protein